MILVIVDVVRWLFNILVGLVIIRAFLSWLPMARGGIVAFVFTATEPMLTPVRKLVDRSPLGGPGMMLDFSPIIVILILMLMQSFIINMIRAIAIF